MKKPKNIPEKAQIISGIGASSWFSINKEKDNYRIERFSVDGELECSRIFTVEPKGFDINKKFKFTYISHCKECNIIQNNLIYNFLTDEY